MTARDVFISHASEDEGVAAQVCALLEARGVRCWIAPRDVPGGSVWDEAILDALEQCRAFLLILSKSANGSHFVKNEVNRAFSQGKPIVTFRLEEVAPGRSLELYLARHHWIDAFPPPLGARVESLASSITALLDGAAATAAASAQPVAPPPRPTVASRVVSPLRGAVKEVRALGWYRQIAVLGVMALVAALASFATLSLRPSPKPLPTMRLNAEIGADATLYTDYGSAAIFSPDGSHLAFVARGSDQKRRIYTRALDALHAAALPGTENARDPFFSPDGEWLGFFADGKLMKISVQGGAAVTLCDALNDRGGSWDEDGTIVFAPNQNGVLSKVSSAGGTPQPLSTSEQASDFAQCWPQVLPGGKTVLFTSTTTVCGGTRFEDTKIVAYSMASGERKTVQLGGFYARYLTSGNVAYVRDGTLFAVPFDLKRLDVTGQPSPIAEGVITNPSTGAAQFSFSDTGNLAYVAGKGGNQNVSIYWMDPEGKYTPVRETPGDYRNPVFSPDGKRLALEIYDGKRSDIWIDEWQSDVLTRLTFDGQSNGFPIWTPDGQRITYASEEKDGTLNLWWTRADGAGGTQRLTEGKYFQYPRSWRPDGKVLVFRQSMPTGAVVDIMTLPMEGDEKTGWRPGEPKPFLNGAFIEEEAAFSPDGRWLAYISTESGNTELYVRPFPGPGGKWQISGGGGRFPKWSRDGKKLFFRTQDNKIMVASYTGSGDSFRVDKPQLWSPGQFNNFPGGISNYDLFPNSERFVVLKTPGAEEAAAVNHVSLVLNFFDELRRKAPAVK